MSDFKKWLESMEPVERGGVITLIIIVLLIMALGLGVQFGQFVGKYLL
ncbi:hypothetical protein [Parashewanella tropica]|nr:hypothetical protein [Parashewanella tropica]